MPRRPRLQLCALEDRTTPTAGLMDTTFGGGDGIVRFGSVPGYYDAVARAIEVQADGKPVAAGYIDSPTGHQALLLRLNEDGSVDTSFDGDGYFISDFGSPGDSKFNDVAIQPDGKIVAVGWTRVSGEVQVLTARFNADGTLDTSFSSDGFATLNPTSGSETGWGLAIQPDGKIVVVGGADITKFLVARYTADGVLDTNFSLDGIHLHNPGGHGAWGYGVAVQPDGKIVAIGGGVEVGSPEKSMLLLRFNTDGSYDSAFNGDGVVTTRFQSNGDAEGNDVAILADGRIAAVGVTAVASMGQQAIAVYQSNGTLDTGFSQDGRIEFDLPDSDGGHLTAVAPQGDGKLIASGWTSISGGNDLILMRINGDGTMDSTFGVGNFLLAPGVVNTNVGSSEYSLDFAFTPDGRIVTGGFADDDASIVRYTGDLLATDDFYEVDEDASLTVDAPGVLENDVPPNASPMTATLVSGPAHAANFTLNSDGSFFYEPAANYSGPDSFSYYFTAGADVSLPAVVSLTVNPTNDPPTANDDEYTLPRMTPLQLSVNAANGVLADDTDPENNALTAILVSAPAVGTLNLSANGSFTYNFPASLTGSVTFTYKVNDGTVDGTTATVTLTRPANQAPTALDDAFEYPFNPPFNAPAPGVLSNDSDPESDALTAEIVSQPATGTVTLAADGSFTYTYPAGFLGPVTFTYRVFDGRDYSAPATVTLTRVPNQPPVAVDDSYAVGLDGTLSVPAITGVNANDSDPEGNTFTASIVSQPAIGQVTLNADGSFSYTGGQDLVGSVTFTYELSDGSETGNTATVTLTRDDIFTSENGKLLIIGSGAAESIRLTASGKGLILELHRATGIVRQTLLPSTAEKKFTSLKIVLGDGDDRVDTTLIGLPVEIDAGAGNNVIRTGKGNDVIAAGDGNNSIDSGKGHDRVTAGNGLNDIRTGIGNDTVTAGDGSNFVDAGAGNDVVTTGAGYDWLLGAAGSDVLDAGAGDDFVDGGTGNDLLVGGLGADVLQGLAGNDILIDGTVALTDPNDSLAKVLKAFVPSKKVLPILLARINVTTDNTAESVFGGAGTDWFWTANDETDRLTKEPLGDAI